MIDDRDRCEWVNVCSGTSSSMLSWTNPESLKMAVCVYIYSLYESNICVVNVSTLILDSVFSGYGVFYVDKITSIYLYTGVWLNLYLLSVSRMSVVWSKSTECHTCDICVGVVSFFIILASERGILPFTISIAFKTDKNE